LVRNKCAVNKVRRYVNRGRECFKRSLGTQRSKFRKIEVASILIST